MLFAYAGFENTAAAAGEFKNPQRDVPFALIVQVGIVTAFYVSVQWVALGTVPNLGASETPLADGARIFLGTWGGWLLTVGAVVSILGTANNSVIAGPRYLFALSRDGFGPRFLASVHPRFRTPAAAILFQGAIAVPLAYLMLRNLMAEQVATFDLSTTPFLLTTGLILGTLFLTLSTQLFKAASTNPAENLRGEQ